MIRECSIVEAMMSRRFSVYQFLSTILSFLWLIQCTLGLRGLADQIVGQTGPCMWLEDTGESLSLSKYNRLLNISFPTADYSADHELYSRSWRSTFQGLNRSERCLSLEDTGEPSGSRRNIGFGKHLFSDFSSIPLTIQRTLGFREVIYPVLSWREQCVGLDETWKPFDSGRPNRNETHPPGPLNIPPANMTYSEPQRSDRLHLKSRLIVWVSGVYQGVMWEPEYTILILLNLWTFRWLISRTLGLREAIDFI